MANQLRTVGLCLILAALVCAAVGTGGFASATADRDMAADEVDDARGYVGYDSPAEVRIEFNESANATNATDPDERTETVALVTVTNRIDAPIDVTSVDVDAPDGLDVTVKSTPADVSPGESREVVAELDCERSFEDGSLSVGIGIEGGTVSAEISGDEADRSVSVTCDGQS